MLRGIFRFTRPPISSLLNRMCIEPPLLMYKRFFGCPATLAISCGVEASFTLLDSSSSGIVFIRFFCVRTLLGFSGLCVLSLLDSLFLFLWCSGICIATLLDFLFFWRIFLLFVVFFVVCIGFDLCGPTLRGFLVGHTTSFHETHTRL